MAWQQQHDGGATESPVSSIAETRSRLLKDRVAEITYSDEPGVYLALVTETPAARANKVSHLWLHEVLDGSGLYIMDPWNRGESKSPIRKVAKPLSSVQELPPAEGKLWRARRYTFCSGRDPERPRRAAPARHPPRVAS